MRVYSGGKNSLDIRPAFFCSKNLLLSLLHYSIFTNSRHQDCLVTGSHERTLNDGFCMFGRSE